jgi:hypothetical protein
VLAVLLQSNLPVACVSQELVIAHFGENNQTAQSYTDLTLGYFVSLVLSVSSVVDLFDNNSLFPKSVVRFVILLCASVGISDSIKSVQPVTNPLPS